MDDLDPRDFEDYEEPDDEENVPLAYRKSPKKEPKPPADPLAHDDRHILSTWEQECIMRNQRSGRPKGGPARTRR